jgi:hypothetical protein
MHFVPMKEHFATKLSANRHANSVAEANSHFSPAKAPIGNLDAIALHHGS